MEVASNTGTLFSDVHQRDGYLQILRWQRTTFCSKQNEKQKQTNKQTLMLGVRGESAGAVCVCVGGG